MTAARRIRLLGLGALLMAPCPGVPQGHGPLYGLSTPTLGRGGWSLDAAPMGRFVAGGTAVMIRPMVSYGLTEDLQLSVSFPLSLYRDEGLPPVRGLTRMPMMRDAQAMLGWRFHRNAVSVGTRWESTAWLGFEYPTDDVRAGIETAPGAYAAAVTGYASRSWYVWAGGAHRRAVGSGLDETRPGDTSMASLVVGYRPAAFRADYPGPDWRGFLELVGEWMGRDRGATGTIEESGGRQIFLAATVLGLYGSWGVSGGPALPLHQVSNGVAPRERLRLAINLTFWF